MEILLLQIVLASWPILLMSGSLFFGIIFGLFACVYFTLDESNNIKLQNIIAIMTNNLNLDIIKELIS